VSPLPVGPPRQQRGIALLTAIILVAIATIVATAVAWQSAMTARRAIAVFTVAQSLALAEGAEAMAGYALRDNRQKNPKFISVSQGWAKPYGPVEIDTGAMLEASLEDQAGKFNLNSVVTQVAGSEQLTRNATGVAQLEALLESLNIKTDYAARLVDWIDSDDEPTFPGGAEDTFYLALDPPHRTPNLPLTSVSELLAMGMDRASYDKLSRLVTALPVDTKLNLCTAPGEVLDALAGTRSYATNPEQLAQLRQQNACFPDVTTYLNGVAPAQQAGLRAIVATTSAYFRLRTWITIGTTRFTLYSLIEQDQSGQIRPLLRTFGTE
jgi:general secretion pathway protein K